MDWAAWRVVGGDGGHGGRWGSSGGVVVGFRFRCVVSEGGFSFSDVTIENSLGTCSRGEMGELVRAHLFMSFFFCALLGFVVGLFGATVFN